jgi:hypothetical protein
MKAAFFLFLFAAGLLLALPACTSQKLAYRLQKMDTLDRIMENLQAVPLVDEDYLRLRNDSISRRLNTILKQMPDSGAADIHFAIVRYAAIRANYQDVLKKYPVLTFDLDQEKSSLADFKKSIIEKKLSDPEFESRFNIHRAHLSELQNRIRDLNYSVAAIENDYRRNSDLLIPIYQKISGRK